MFKKENKTAVPTSAPIEEVIKPEVIDEKEVVGKLEEIKKPVKFQEQKVQYVPMYLSQDQINNMIVENNLMLKEIISNIKEE